LSSYYCDANSAECRFDRNATFTETDDYETCLSIRKAVIENKAAQMTWAVVGLGVLGFLVFFIGCLYCIHRRNVRQMNRKAKINNQNVKPMAKAKQLDPAELTDEHVNSSPEKLLIKRSDV